MIRNFFASRAWQPPSAWLHVLAIPDLPDGLGDIASRYQQMLRPLHERGALSLVSKEFLHLTVAKLRPAADVSSAHYEQLLSELRRGLRQLTTIDVQVGPAVVGRSNVRLAVYPERPVDQLIDVVHQAATTALDQPFSPPAALPHITIAYGTRDDPDADLCLVNDLRGGRTDWTIREVAVVDQEQDIVSGTYRWTLRDTIPLGELR